MVAGDSVLEDISQITDYADLLKRPGFNPVLSFDRKGGRTFGKVLLPYHFSEPVPCGIASCRTPHLKGYLITSSDNLETIIGQVCGKRVFGMSFTRQRQRIDQAVADARRKETIQQMIRGMPAMIEVIERLEREYKFLQDLKYRLMGALDPRLYKELRTRAERGSAVVTRSVPMTEEEAAIVFETTNRRRNDGLGWPHKELPICTLEGLEFIKSPFKDMLVTNLITPLRRLSRMRPDEVLEMGRRELAREAKWVGEVPQGIVLAEEVVAAGHRFFTSANIANLVHIGANRDVLAAMVADLKRTEEKRKASY